MTVLIRVIRESISMAFQGALESKEIEMELAGIHSKFNRRYCSAKTLTKGVQFQQC